jgi:alpha-amylase
MKQRSLVRALTAISASSLLIMLFAGAPAKAATGPDNPVPNKLITSQSVGIQMFMYNWNSIGSECVNVLGPEGIDWVQTSPPQEHVNGAQWWVHYQPVSYKLESSLGTERQFRAMVAKCNSVGVQVIVDAVINHMANSSGVGYAGSSFSKYNYPGIYNSTDFHAGLTDHSSPRYCTHSINSYDSIPETTSCELGGLPDLATEKPNVRQTIADYLNHMLDIGVAGFRVDAAKHIGSDDLSAIVSMLHPVNGHAPYISSEVIGSAAQNSPFTQLSYNGTNNVGDVWSWGSKDTFKTALKSMDLSSFGNLGWSAGFNGSDNTITIVSNHDDEHHGPSALTYRDTTRYTLASMVLLAVPFGKPELYTGYAFTDENNGPGTDYSVNPNGVVMDAWCPLVDSKPTKIQDGSGLYACLQRQTAIKAMIDWHHQAGTSPAANVTTFAGANYGLLSFSRGTNFVAMNPLGTPRTITVKTGLAAGTYCDSVSGGVVAFKTVKKVKSCLGTKVIVNAKGSASITIAGTTAVALTMANKIG